MLIKHPNYFDDVARAHIVYINRRSDASVSSHDRGCQLCLVLNLLKSLLKSSCDPHELKVQEVRTVVIPAEF